MKYLPQFIGLTILNITDIVTTYLIVGYNIALEANPYAAWLISNYGYFGIFVGKFIPILILGLLLYFLKEESEIVKYALAFSIVIYLIVVLTSASVLL